MSTEAMQRAWNELPQGDQRVMVEAKSHLMGVADQITEPIIGLICAAPNAQGYSALVITPSRIVEMTTGGAMQVLKYAELSGVQNVGGARKRFGSKHEPFYFRVLSKGGGVRTYPLFGDHEYNARIGAAAEAACRRSQLAQ